MATRVRAPAASEARSPLPTMDVSEKELETAFADVSDPALLKKLSQLCRTYGLSAEDLQNKWEVLCVTDPLGNMKMSVDTLSRLELRCSSGKQAADAKTPATLQASRRPTSTFTKDAAHLLQAGKMLSTSTPQRAANPAGAPISPLLSTSPSAGSPGGTFASRQDSGKVVHTANPLLGPAGGMVQLHVEPEPLSTHNTHSMWERPEDRARLLDEGVATFEQELVRRPLA